MDKTTKFEIIIITLLIAILGISFICMKTTEIKSEKEKINTEVIALADVNRFFVIDSVVAKYFSYISSKKGESILQVLDKEYVERNNITSSNIYNFVGNYDINIKSKLEEAYQVSTYKNVYKYYVKVSLKLETLYDSTLQNYVYYIVTIDENELTFAIEPISGNLYNSKLKGDD